MLGTLGVFLFAFVFVEAGFEIAERLGFDAVIGTGSIIGLDERVHAKIAGENCYGPAKLRMITDWVERSGLEGVHGHVRFYSDHVSDQPAFGDHLHDDGVALDGAADAELDALTGRDGVGRGVSLDVLDAQILVR